MIVYVLLSGCEPFANQQAIRKAQFHFHPLAHWRKVPAEAKQLVWKLLVVSRAVLLMPLDDS